MRQTKDHLKQLIETMDVMNDKKLMPEIALSRRDAESRQEESMSRRATYVSP